MKLKLFLLIYGLCITQVAGAESITTSLERNKTKESIVLPYLFSTDSTGLTLGAVGIFSGYGQKNMTTVATAFAGQSLAVEKQGATEPTTANTKGFAFAVNGYRAQALPRLSLSFLGAYSYYPNKKLYLDGSNNSEQSSRIETQGYSNWFELPIRYTLPLGENKTDPITHYKLSHGMITERDEFGGGKPFISGSTHLELKAFYNKWSADKLAEEKSWNSNGLKLSLTHDNTDFNANPSRGYKFDLTYSQDFGVANSSQSWNSLEGGYAHFIPLNNFSWSTQNTLAFNIWTAFSPSWQQDQQLNAGGVIDNHQAPPWEGARLGGWRRMRGYDANRFSDKAAIYYACEYRVTLNFNPLKRKSWLPLSIDWFQVVGFAELGRVAPEYKLAELHQDLKYDVGLSLRALAATVPVRFDLAYGQEGTSMWVMINQPF